MGQGCPHHISAMCPPLLLSPPLHFFSSSVIWLWSPFLHTNFQRRRHGDSSQSAKSPLPLPPTSGEPRSYVTTHIIMSCDFMMMSPPCIPLLLVMLMPTPVLNIADPNHHGSYIENLKALPTNKLHGASFTIHWEILLSKSHEQRWGKGLTSGDGCWVH